MKYDIFISYRREGGYDTAKHLNDLQVRDGYRVSFDIDTLRNGDFDSQLLERIDQCKNFILIVNQHALGRTLDPTFDPQKDWLRCELAYALKKTKYYPRISLWSYWLSRESFRRCVWGCKKEWTIVDGDVFVYNFENVSK